MAKTVSDTLRETLLQIALETLRDLDEEPQKQRNGRSRGRGLLAGIGLVAAVSLAKRALAALDDGSPGDLPEPSAGPRAAGKDRWPPIRQAVDVEVPLESAYHRFTRFEDWPRFLPRVTQVTPEDDRTFSLATKVWGRTRNFEARVETQRPDERVEWRVSEGITHAGVATFRELAPDLARLEVTLEVPPGSLIEKAARGMRDVNRTLRADLHRFKAFAEREPEERPEPARRPRNRFVSQNGHGKPERVGSGGGRRAR
jgi:uncharacterized membrane protein